MTATIIILSVLLCIFFAWNMALRGENRRLCDINERWSKDYNTVFQRDVQHQRDIEYLRSLLANKKEEFQAVLRIKDQAIEEATKSSAMWATAAGIAEAKLAGSKAAGALESWQLRARTAEKALDEARREIKLAEQIMKDDKAAASVLHETITLHVAEIHRQRERCSLAVQAMAGDYWIWSEDEDNHLESLVCPVVIAATTLRAIVERAQTAEAAMKRLVTPVPIDQLHEDHGNVLAFTIEDNGEFGGDVQLVHRCDNDFDESDYTHFIPMPNIEMVAGDSATTITIDDPQKPDPYAHLPHGGWWVDQGTDRSLWWSNGEKSQWYSREGLFDGDSIFTSMGGKRLTRAQAIAIIEQPQKTKPKEVV